MTEYQDPRSDEGQEKRHKNVAREVLRLRLRPHPTIDDIDIAAASRRNHAVRGRRGVPNGRCETNASRR
jgi:hypothetical protein